MAFSEYQNGETNCDAHNKVETRQDVLAHGKEALTSRVKADISVEK